MNDLRGGPDDSNNLALALFAILGLCLQESPKLRIVPEADQVWIVREMRIARESVGGGAVELDRLGAEKLPVSRKGTRWDLVLQTIVTYRLLDPGSEWKLHRQWFESSAMADLLGEDFGLAEMHKLYECLDLLLPHKQALFDHLTGRWKDLFNTKYEVLLYDLTSTCFVLLR